MMQAPPRQTPRHEATRREVRRGMMTWANALMEHIEHLEARLRQLEARGAETRDDTDDDTTKEGQA